MNLAVSAPDGSLPIAVIVAARLGRRCCSELGPACWLRPGPPCCFSHCCIVPARCGGAAQRIVLPSWGHCPTPMCLFMLLLSLSGQPRFYATHLWFPQSLAPRHQARCECVHVWQGCSPNITVWNIPQIWENVHLNGNRHIPLNSRSIQWGIFETCSFR